MQFGKRRHFPDRQPTRSGAEFRQAAQLVRNGKIGKIEKGDCQYRRSFPLVRPAHRTGPQGVELGNVVGTGPLSWLQFQTEPTGNPSFLSVARLP